MNKFYNEDCNTTMNNLNSDSIDLIFTSPPYYNAREYSQYSDVNEYMEQMKDVFTNAHRVLKESRMCVINISPVLVPRASRSEQSYRIPLPFYFVPMMEDIGFEFLEDIIWKKPEGSATNRNGGFYRSRKPLAYKPNIITEYILVFKKKAPFLLDKVLKDDSKVEDGYERSNVWEINPETKSWHSAPFPQELSDRVIKYYSYENDIVYDPFAGSGTTGKSAEKLNRQYILSELDSDIYDMAMDKW